MYLLIFLTSSGLPHGSTAPPIGPRPRPDVVLPPGTHLLFAQSGRIDHIPLEAYNMKKQDAKAVLHLPVSFFHKMFPRKSKDPVLNSQNV